MGALFGSFDLALTLATVEDFLVIVGMATVIAVCLYSTMLILAGFWMLAVGCLQYCRDKQREADHWYLAGQFAGMSVPSAVRMLLDDDAPAANQRLLRRHYERAAQILDIETCDPLNPKRQRTVPEIKAVIASKLKLDPKSM